MKEKGNKLYPHMPESTCIAKQKIKERERMIMMLSFAGHFLEMEGGWRVNYCTPIPNHDYCLPQKKEKKRKRKIWN